MAQNIDISLLSSQRLEAWLCKRLEATRLSRNINQTQLAEQAGVSRRTISRMENGQGVSLDTFLRVMRALDLQSSLSRLIPDPCVRPIDRVKQSGRTRKRASTPRNTKADGVTESAWRWGDQ